MRLFSFLSTLFLLMPSAHAASGFTWLGTLAHKFHVPEHVLTFAFVGLLIMVGGFVYRSKLSKVSNLVIPDKGITFRNIVEAYGKFIYKQCHMVLGEDDAPKYFQFVSVIFILIFVSNVIGLIPGFLPPTESINTTLALGLFSFIYYNIIGCKEMGPVEYFKHFCGPLWYLAFLILPIELISNVVRPISLALRLQGNMMGDHIVLQQFSNLEVFGINLALFVPMPFYLLGLLVSFIQAYVFTMLSMVYISLASAHHDHDEAHAH